MSSLLGFVVIVVAMVVLLAVLKKGQPSKSVAFPYESCRVLFLPRNGLSSGLKAKNCFLRLSNFLEELPMSESVILPRNEKTQRELVYRTWPRWCEERKIIVPGSSSERTGLIWYSDLVVSGGGTMNREAAALGVPVYSIFRGKIGAVDKYLAENGRLILIETVEDVRSRIRPVSAK